MPNDWITTADAVALSGYHPERIRELARERKIKAQKWGRDWQISRSSLLRYLQTARKSGEKPGPKKRLTDDKE